MKQVNVGFYHIGPMQAGLVLRDGFGGEFYAVPGTGEVCRIKVGVNGGWKNAVSVLHHEALEFCFMQAGLRYSPAPDYSNDNGAYLFNMNHTQFSEASSRASMFMADALPDMAKAFRKWKKR